MTGRSSIFLFGDTDVASPQNLLSMDGRAYHVKKFLNSVEADSYLSAIVGSSPWRQDHIKIFGRSVLQPRLTAWMGDRGASYRYSGLLMTPEPWSEAVLQIKSAIEKALGLKFNSALLNYYRTGFDSMGWHRDNEPELGKDPTIASVSLGDLRIFKMRHYFNKSLGVDIELGHGDLLVMAGVMQSNWEHCLPKTRRPKGPRVNITFRSVDIPKN
jgi:alkylated DNA repair dioxygenase AlkB